MREERLVFVYMCSGLPERQDTKMHSVAAEGIAPWQKKRRCVWGLLNPGERPRPPGLRTQNGSRGSYLRSQSHLSYAREGPLMALIGMSWDRQTFCTRRHFRLHAAEKRHDVATR